MEPATWSAPPPARPAGSSAPGCLTMLLFAFAALYCVGVVVVVQFVAWSYDQIQQATGMETPGWFWAAVALGQALLLALPVAPLAWLTRVPAYRAAYRAWGLAIAAGALLGLVRLNPVTWTQPAAVAQIALCLIAALALSRLKIEHGESRSDRPPASFSTLGLALSIGIAVILPWLRYGALGSPIDTLLGLLAAASFGLLAGALLDRFLLGPLRERSADSAEDRNGGSLVRMLGLAGVAAGVALLMLGAGFGYGGQQIPLMIGLLPLGGAVAALGWWGRRSAIAALVGAVAAGPLLLLDPDEFSLLLQEEIGWVFRASFLAALAAGAAGLALWLLAGRLARPPRRALALGSLAAAVAAGALIYAGAGQPGFYGERLFVILRDQADLGQARGIADRAERLRFVYITLTRHAADSQAGLRAALDRFGVAYRPYYLVNAIEVDGGPLVRAYLAARPEVERIIDSPRLRPLALPPAPPPETPAPPPSGVEWNVAAIGADRVWDELGVRGEGIVLGESDSGVQGDHPALREGYRGRDAGDDYSWLDPWNGSPAPVDLGGHGTHTTGTAVGRGGIGVAPGAEWIGCVNLARNLGNPAHYLDCMQFMLAPYPRAGDPFADGDPARAAHVLNNSWGCPPLEGCDPGALEAAVSALRAAGIFVVASAGNDGPRCSSVADPIAIYADAFSVGAIDRSGDIADFSSRGPVTVDGSNRVKPDIVAPGVDIRSAWPGGGYNSADGTSMAGPHVAGVVALMWSAQPRLIGDVDRTERILRETARPYEGQLSGCGAAGVPNDTAGYGVVDAYAAVKAAQALP